MNASGRARGRGKGKHGKGQRKKGGTNSEKTRLRKEAKELKLLQREAAEIKTLTKRVIEEAPESGDTASEKIKFTDLPLSQYTLQAMKMAK